MYKSDVKLLIIQNLKVSLIEKMSIILMKSPLSIFLCFSYRPAPLFVLDGIDAGLDQTNIEKVAAFFERKRDELQIITTSLDEDFSSHADVLIGIFRAVSNVANCIVSYQRRDLIDRPQILLQHKIHFGYYFLFLRVLGEKQSR